MTHHHRETIDETIDRVAAQLTMVPADPALAGRIAEQLDTDAPFAWMRWLLATGAVAAVAVLAVVVFNSSRAPQPADIARATAPVPGPTGETPHAEAARASASPQIAMTAPTRGVTRRRSAEAHPPLPELPQIDALESPVLLAVDNIPTKTLTIEPVDLAPLDLANLAVRELGERDDPKE